MSRSRRTAASTVEGSSDCSEEAYEWTVESRWTGSLCVSALVAGLAGAAWPDQRLEAHGTEARYVELVQWKKERFARVFGVGTSALGVPGSRNSLQMRMIENKACVLGSVVAFDVDDTFAFDVDEPVTLTVTYAPALSTPFVVGWDKNGGTGIGTTDPITPEPGPVLQTLTLTLDRARLAGQGTQGSDIAIGSRMGLALCDVAISRSGTTRPAASFGQVRLTVKDATTGTIVPARVGMYDETGGRRWRRNARSCSSATRTTFECWQSTIGRSGRHPTDRPSTSTGTTKRACPPGPTSSLPRGAPSFGPTAAASTCGREQTTDVAISLERYADLPAAAGTRAIRTFI